MKKTIMVVAVCLCAITLSYGQSGFSGTWVTTDFGTTDPHYLDLKVEGTKATGTISRRLDVDAISEGLINGSTVTFKVTVANGGRINSYTGKLNGNTIAFTRTVKVRDEVANAGAGIYGASGPMQFTAKRDTAADTAMKAFYGNWKANIAKSKYTPGPAPNPVSPQVRQFAVRGNGMVASTYVGANELGSPNLSVSTAKIDGKDYPVHNQATLVGVIAGEKPITNTIAIKTVDPRTIEVTTKANNAVSGVSTLTVSADGKTLTETAKLLDTNGKQIGTNVLVFDRIP